MMLFFKQRDDVIGIAPHPWGVHPARYYATTLRAMGLQVPTTLFYKFKVTPLEF